MKVISWCFYVNPSNIKRLPEYLVGLKANKIAARWWFNDWKCRLYYDPLNLENYPEVGEYVKEICQNDLPVIEMIPVRKNYPLITERYLPFFEKDIQVSIVRDIDSILSYTDSCIVNKWLTESDSKVLRYLEYKMKLFTMGGGIAVRGSFPPELDFTKVIDQIQYVGCVPIRGYDEDVMSDFFTSAVEKNIINDVYTIYTRMTENGIYYVKDTLQILWMIPFYETETGCAHKLENGKYKKVKTDATLSVIFSKERKVKSDLLLCHLQKNKFKVEQQYLEWVR